VAYDIEAIRPKINWANSYVDIKNIKVKADCVLCGAEGGDCGHVSPKLKAKK